VGRVCHLDHDATRLLLADHAPQFHLQRHASHAAGAGCRPERHPARRRFAARAGHDPDRNAVHLRQNAGVSTTSSVNSSRRPSSMAKEQIQVWKSFSTA
jgi:hypothetical protein